LSVTAICSIGWDLGRSTHNSWSLLNLVDCQADTLTTAIHGTTKVLNTILVLLEGAELLYVLGRDRIVRVMSLVVLGFVSGRSAFVTGSSLHLAVRAINVGGECKFGLLLVRRAL
jgi:hypothetical protein